MNTLLTSIEELVQYTSWLVTASRSVGGDDEKEGSGAASGTSGGERKQGGAGGANDWVASLSEGQWIPGMSNVSLPASAAVDRSLFNDLFLHVSSTSPYGANATTVCRLMLCEWFDRM